MSSSIKKYNALVHWHNEQEEVTARTREALKKAEAKMQEQDNVIVFFPATDTTAPYQITMPRKIANAKYPNHKKILPLKKIN